jgi:hypothetical protein
MSLTFTCGLRAEGRLTECSISRLTCRINMTRHGGVLKTAEDVGPDVSCRLGPSSVAASSNCMGKRSLCAGRGRRVNVSDVHMRLE